MDNRNHWHRLLLSIALPLVSASIYFYFRQRKSLRDNNDNPVISRKSKAKFSIIEEEGRGAIESSDNTRIEHIGGFTSLGLEQPLVIAMVGLPARGKSYIVKMIIRYLTWSGFESEVFNVGSYRRKLGLAAAESNFFDASNSSAHKLREQMAMAVQDMMYAWLHEGDGIKKRVAIFDATNTTRARRMMLAQRSRAENAFLLYVESICTDEVVLRRNYELKLKNDDYKGMDQKVALNDFIERVRAYERVYETIEDDEDGGNISYIKLINVGQKVITHHCTGYLPSQVAFYLQNVHIEPRKIYLTLNSETESVNGGHVVGSSCGIVRSCSLSEAGHQYSMDLAKFLQLEQDNIKGPSSQDVLILSGTSSLQAETILHLRMLFSCYTTPLLNDLREGDLQGMNDDDIKQFYPVEFEKKQQDPLNYRYPGSGGESYMDIIERIRPIIIELERQRRNVMVVCHLSVLRCIYSYFMGTKRSDITFLPFKRHHIYELTPGPFGCSCREVSPSESQMIY